VPLGELPGGHRYAEDYKRTDPVIRQGPYLCRSFSAFVMERVLHRWQGEEVGKLVLVAHIGRGDPRYGRLLTTDDITEDQGIAVDYRYDHGDLNAAFDTRYDRFVILNGFQPNETTSPHLWARDGT